MQYSNIFMHPLVTIPMTMPHLQLDSLKTGQSAVIVSINTEPNVQQRLNALGLRSGQEIHLLRKAWLKGPLHLQVGMTEVMLRRCDARQIAIASRGMA